VRLVFLQTARYAHWWGIFPDLYQPFIPRVNLVVKYPNATVYRGNRLTPTQVRPQKPKTTKLSDEAVLITDVNDRLLIYLCSQKMFQKYSTQSRRACGR
jgi:hypothetical protein